MISLNAYKQIDFNLLKIDGYAIVPMREQDILKIKDWRNAQMDILRQKQELTDEDQIRYYREVVRATFSQTEPSQMLFSFMLDQRCIGYGGITNIDWESKHTELSFLTDNNRLQDPSVYEREFPIFLSLIKSLVFNQLNMNRIYTETYDIRPLHISVLEKNGFVMEGRMRQHVRIAGAYYDALIHSYLREQYTGSL